MAAWADTDLVIKRVTIDTGCINQLQKDDDLNTLEHWEKEGHITLQRSDALLAELKGRPRIEKAELIEPLPPVWVLGTSGLGIDTRLAGPDMTELARKIMFPTTDILTGKQNYNVEHLQAHVLTGGDVFVTKNPNDFLVRRKKESLMSLGIWVFQPADLVELLHDLYQFG